MTNAQGAWRALKNAVMECMNLIQEICQRLWDLKAACKIAQAVEIFVRHKLSHILVTVSAKFRLKAAAAKAGTLPAVEKAKNRAAGEATKTNADAAAEAAARKGEKYGYKNFGLRMQKVHKA